MDLCVKFRSFVKFSLVNSFKCLILINQIVKNFLGKVNIQYYLKMISIGK